MRRSEAAKLADRLDRKKNHEVEQIVRRNLASDSWAVVVRRQLDDKDDVLMFEKPSDVEKYLGSKNQNA